jgi:hypothetical protein
MNQNIFCSKCHRIPSQCCCSSTKELTDEEIKEEIEKMFGKIIDPEVLKDELNLARAILRKASEK